jgi:hypothetical protein
MYHEQSLRDSFGESDEKVFSLKSQITKNEDSNTSTKRNQGQGMRDDNFECVIKPY